MAFYARTKELPKTPLPSSNKAVGDTSGLKHIAEVYNALHRSGCFTVTNKASRRDQN